MVLRLLIILIKKIIRIGKLKFVIEWNVECSKPMVIMKIFMHKNSFLKMEQVQKKSSIIVKMT